MIIIAIVLILIILLINYNLVRQKEINSLINKKEFVETKITKYLDEKGDLLDKICTEINKLSNKKIFNNLNDIKNDYEDLMKKDNILKSINHELKDYMLINKNYVPSKNVNEKLNKLKSLNIELEASEKYYNDISDDFNKIISLFPFNVIAKKRGLDYLYQFNLEKEVFFKILKKDKKL